jgi:acetyl esterase/lipase
VPGAFTGHASLRDPMQLAMHERDEALERALIPFAPLPQQVGDVRPIVGNAGIVSPSRFGRHFPLLRAGAISQHDLEGRHLMKRRYRSRLASLVCACLIGIAGALAIAAPDATGARELVPPTEHGPYNVGSTLFTATMSGGRVARVQVFYPTRAAADPASVYTIVTPAGSYRIRSPLGAAVNAVAEPGAFPLIAYDHGGAGAGGDIQRVTQLPLHELMATHGFVVVVALHSADFVARARDLSLLIDHALVRNATAGDILYGSIDPARIGVSGFSAGGGSAINAAVGITAAGLPADGRIKAMVAYEPGVNDVVDDVSAISFPYLLLRGTELDHFTGGMPAQEALSAFFATTVAATPRIQVLTPDAVHVNFNTGLCDLIDQTREQALLANPALPEPLTTLTASNAAAAAAYMNWNMGQTQFPNNGAGFGGGRNVCHQVGVSSVRSLDVTPVDGETDSPPLVPVDPPYTPVAPPSQSVMVTLVAHYTIAFWKTFLEGDHRYMRYLTPGYANVNGFPTQVTIAE